MRFIAGLPSIFSMCVKEPRECLVVCYGCVPYLQALDLQMKICEMKKSGYDKDVLLLLEHPPTVTLGRNASGNHLLVKESDLKARGVGLCHVDRGGDVTFHGPGQLVGYPILYLQPGERDVHRFMRNLEESLIRLLSGYGIAAERDQRFTGVWTEEGKIAAMGVHIGRWITRHGFALNVNTDLTFYNLIVPCGIVGRSVTSMQQLLSCTMDMAEVADRYIPEFSAVFHREMIRMSEKELAEEIGCYTGAVNGSEACDSTIV